MNTSKQHEHKQHEHTNQRLAADACAQFILLLLHRQKKSSCSSTYAAAQCAVSDSLHVWSASLIASSTFLLICTAAESRRVQHSARVRQLVKGGCKLCTAGMSSATQNVYSKTLNPRKRHACAHCKSTAPEHADRQNYYMLAGSCLTVGALATKNMFICFTYWRVWPHMHAAASVRARNALLLPVAQAAWICWQKLTSIHMLPYIAWEWHTSRRNHHTAAWQTLLPRWSANLLAASQNRQQVLTLRQCINTIHCASWCQHQANTAAYQNVCFATQQDAPPARPSLKGALSCAQR
jgi:hypothetical protein